MQLLTNFSQIFRLRRALHPIGFRQLSPRTGNLEIRFYFIHPSGLLALQGTRKRGFAYFGSSLVDFDKLFHHNVVFGYRNSIGESFRAPGTPCSAITTCSTALQGARS